MSFIFSVFGGGGNLSILYSEVAFTLLFIGPEEILLCSHVVKVHSMQLWTVWWPLLQVFLIQWTWTTCMVDHCENTSSPKTQHSLAHPDSTVRISPSPCPVAPTPLLSGPLHQPHCHASQYPAQGKKSNTINPSAGEAVYRNCTETIHSLMMAEGSMKSWTHLSESNLISILKTLQLCCCYYMYLT